MRSSLYTTAIVLTFSSGSEGATGVSGLSVSAAWPFFLSPFLSFPFPVPGSPDLGRRGTNGMLDRKKNHVSLLIARMRPGGPRCAKEPPCRKKMLRAEWEEKRDRRKQRVRQTTAVSNVDTFTCRYCSQHCRSNIGRITHERSCSKGN